MFANPDPEVWRRIAERHDVTLVVERPGGRPVGFDAAGEALAEVPAISHASGILAVRTAADGTRVTILWRLWTFGGSHFPLLSGFLIMVVTVVGSAFWFLQKQLKPLAWLHTGVEAVSRGDFEARVPVVRDDEIGEVAGAFNEMTSRVREMIDGRERLLADVSHELRSPIARMKVALEFMPTGDKRDALARDLKEMESLISVLLEREELRSRADRIDGSDVDLDADSPRGGGLLRRPGPRRRLRLDRSRDDSRRSRPGEAADQEPGRQRDQVLSPGQPTGRGEAGNRRGPGDPERVRRRHRDSSWKRGAGVRTLRQAGSGPRSRRRLRDRPEPLPAHRPAPRRHDPSAAARTARYRGGRDPAPNSSTRVGTRVASWAENPGEARAHQVSFNLDTLGKTGGVQRCDSDVSEGCLK